MFGMLASGMIPHLPLPRRPKIASDRIGNLIRLLEPPEGSDKDKFSLLDWYLITNIETEGSIQVKDSEGKTYIVPKEHQGKEYDFKSFELETAEQLAEHLVLLNKKMDIIQVETEARELPSWTSTYTVPTTVPFTTTTSGTVGGAYAPLTTTVTGSFGTASGSVWHTATNQAAAQQSVSNYSTNSIFLKMSQLFKTNTSKADKDNDKDSPGPAKKA